MALGDFHLLSRNYAYDLGAVASTSGTSVGANTPDLTTDKLRATFWETADVQPQLKIDLLSAQTIDSLWFQSANVKRYHLFYSVDDAIYNPALSEMFSFGTGYDYFIGFDPQSARYWRLDITEEESAGTNTRIHEVMLMKQQITYADAEVVGTVTNELADPGGGGYRLADGSFVRFAGASERGKHMTNISFTFASLQRFDELESLWTGPPRRPTLTVFPEPDDRPEKIFEMVFDDIDMNYADAWKGLGFSGSIQLIER